MNMKCYEFKDGRRIFRWIYLVLLLDIIGIAVSFFGDKLSGTPMVSSISVFMVIGYLIVMNIFFRKTRTQVFVNDTTLKAKKAVPFVLITEIKVNYDIEINTDSTMEVIKLIDIENNYDKYKELLDYILSKVDKKVAQNAGNADELLQLAVTNIKRRYNSHKLANGKVELGGWLTYFDVAAHFGAVAGIIAIITLIASSVFKIGQVGTQQTSTQIQIVTLLLISIITIILLKRRKNSVKYALAAQPLSGIISGAYASIKNMIGGTEFIYILLIVLGLIVNVVTSIYMIKIYIEYIDTFERPKQTLTN